GGARLLLPGVAVSGSTRTIRPEPSAERRGAPRRALTHAARRASPRALPPALRPALARARARGAWPPRIGRDDIEAQARGVPAGDANERRPARVEPGEAGLVLRPGATPRAADGEVGGQRQGVAPGRQLDAEHVARRSLPGRGGANDAVVDA